MTNTSKVSVIAGVIVFIALLGSIVALAINKDITGVDAMAAIGTLITLFGGGGIAAFGFTQGTKAGLNAAAIIQAQQPQARLEMPSGITRLGVDRTPLN